MTEPTKPGSDLPDRIGKYEIRSRLGKGSMGVVYHAHDPLLDRDVALKVMAPHVAGDPDQKARFEREARAVAKIVHPHVLTVFDLGYHHDGSPYIAMELLKGKDLLQTLRQDEPLSLERKLDIVAQLLDGLAYAHQVGIVHRDIKPANVFLTVDGTVKLMDFGIARFTMTAITGTGAVMGTADYMSPEQVQGEKVDGRTDLWSAACVLHELLTGQRPFAGESLMTVFFKITHEEPNLALPPDYEGLRPILRKALAKDPAERYQTAAEFGGELREFLKSRPSAGAEAAPAPPAAAARGTVDLLSALAEEAKAAYEAPAAAPVAPPVAVPAAPIPPPAVVRAATDPTPLFRLMRDIYVGAKSGHLHFTHGQERRSLFFLRGHILHGTSDVEGEHLGNILVRYGVISQPDLERATPIVLRERKRLGSVLHDLGILDKSRLEQAVGLHVRDILFNVCDRSDGTFAFEEMGAEASMGAEVAGQVAPGEMILEAARRLQAPRVMEQVLGDLDRALVLSSNPLLRVQKLTLSPTDGFLLSRIDGMLTAREIFQIIPLPQEDTERSLFALLCTGTVEYLPRTATLRARASRQAAPAAAPPRPAAAKPPAPPPSPLPARPQPPTSHSEAGRDLQAKEAKRALEARRREILEAFEALQNGDYFELLGVGRTATEQEVRRAYLHLAKSFHPDAPLDPTLDGLRSKREAVFLRLGEAAETLRNPSTRVRYERMLDARSPRPAPDATPQAPPASAPVAGPQAPPPVEAEARDPALQAVRAATLLIKEEKYWDAIQLLERALAQAQGPMRHKVRVTLARAYAKNPKWLHRAQEMLQAVVRESPDFAEAYVVLGSVYRASDLRSRAAAMYTKALEFDPGNQEALAELAAVRAAGEPVAETQASAILKKLFRKR